MAYNPLQFVLAVQSLCPGVQPFVDFLAADHGDGAGPVISQWNRTDIEQPTLTQIQAVDTDALLAKAEIPQTVTPRQARLALLAAGLLDQVTTAVNAAGGATLITWEYASSFDRNDPLITRIGASLNLTSAQIDALFEQAAAL